MSFPIIANAIMARAIMAKAIQAEDYGSGLPPIPGLPDLVYGLTSMISSGVDQTVLLPVANSYRRVSKPSITMSRIKDITDLNDLSFKNEGLTPISITGRVYLYGRPNGANAGSSINVSVGTDNSGVDSVILSNTGSHRVSIAGFSGPVLCYICDYQVLLQPNKSVFPMVKNNTVADFLVRSGKHRVWGEVI